jgi:hypothetical protein
MPLNITEELFDLFTSKPLNLFVKEKKLVYLNNVSLSEVTALPWFGSKLNRTSPECSLFACL